MKPVSPKILVIDDDPRLRELLVRYLTEQGFQVQALPDARELDKKLQRDPPHLLVLDLMLPGEDVDRIVGLELGADDYLAKPFNPRELVARVHAVLRRRTELLAPGGPAADGRIVFGPYLLDLSTRTLLRGETPIPLTTGEFGLLKVLATHPRQPLAREQLMLLARGRDHDVFDRAIDVQISRLRKLVEPDPSAPRFIQTVWGFGYVFVPDAASATDGAGA